jgi:hypothetical protein
MHIVMGRGVLYPDAHCYGTWRAVAWCILLWDVACYSLMHIVMGRGVLCLMHIVIVSGVL